MTAVLSGTNGLLQSYDYQVLTTGFTYTFAAGTQVLVINPAGTLATGTITMPASPADGMTITFSSSQQITALTLSGNTGQTVVGAVTFLPAKTGVTYIYRATGTTWYPTATVPGTGSQLVSGTTVASTSGTSIDFIGIPSWVKRIVIMYSGVSTSATANWQIQLGTGATPTYTTSGYASTMIVASVGAATVSNASTGFVHTAPSVASQITSGQITLYNQTGNIWVSQGAVGASVATRSYVHSGSLSLGNVLTAFRITTTSTDTFNAGSINILYE
ncbi:hypothetical protein UFOVP162_44 [uncultured Caudovirales phage]|uniref:Uncharacterized protein n=1 Tax=uncultured Caudovirales phage TaxID=2100421 RepID=A0A6J7XPE6_9CAUD|nr:hypothetical protein UFOVP162_44 [uncultured Caudovirales phage]